MPRKPLGDSAMTETVKFRCSAEELQCLRDLAENENISVVLREMIRRECQE